MSSGVLGKPQFAVPQRVRPLFVGTTVPAIISAAARSLANAPWWRHTGS
jgi:hypothetical protein